jgi:protein TonB
VKKERKDESFIKKPIYKGGGKAMNEFIYGLLKYPKEAAESKIEGVVFCKYDIDYQGNVIDVRVIKGIGYGCDEEAVRVVKLLKFEIPKNPRNLKILFHKDIQIHFKPVAVQIPKPSTQAPQQGFQISYHIVADKNEKTMPVQKENTYNYSIKIN